jgi:hypothetical protein
MHIYSRLFRSNQNRSFYVRSNGIGLMILGLLKLGLLGGHQEFYLKSYDRK